MSATRFDRLCLWCFRDTAEFTPAERDVDSIREDLEVLAGALASLHRAPRAAFIGTAATFQRLAHLEQLRADCEDWDGEATLDGFICPRCEGCDGCGQSSGERCERCELEVQP